MIETVNAGGPSDGQFRVIVIPKGTVLFSSYKSRHDNTKHAFNDFMEAYLRNRRNPDFAKNQTCSNGLQNQYNNYVFFHPCPFFSNGVNGYNYNAQGWWVVKSDIKVVLLLGYTMSPPNYKMDRSEFRNGQSTRRIIGDLNSNSCAHFTNDDGSYTWRVPGPDTTYSSNNFDFDPCLFPPWMYDNEIQGFISVANMDAFARMSSSLYMDTNREAYTNISEYNLKTSADKNEYIDYVNQFTAVSTSGTLTSINEYIFGIPEIVLFVGSFEFIKRESIPSPNIVKTVAPLKTGTRTTFWKDNTRNSKYTSTIGSKNKLRKFIETNSDGEPGKCNGLQSIVINSSLQTYFNKRLNKFTTDAEIDNSFMEPSTARIYNDMQVMYPLYTAVTNNYSPTSPYSNAAINTEVNVITNKMFNTMIERNLMKFDNCTGFFIIPDIFFTTDPKNFQPIKKGKYSKHLIRDRDEYSSKWFSTSRNVYDNPESSPIWLYSKGNASNPCVMHYYTKMRTALNDKYFRHIKTKDELVKHLTSTLSSIEKPYKHYLPYNGTSTVIIVQNKTETTILKDFLHDLKSEGPKPAISIKLNKQHAKIFMAFLAVATTCLILHGLPIAFIFGIISNSLIYGVGSVISILTSLMSGAFQFAISNPASTIMFGGGAGAFLAGRLIGKSGTIKHIKKITSKTASILTTAGGVVSNVASSVLNFTKNMSPTTIKTALTSATSGLLNSAKSTLFSNNSNIYAEMKQAIKIIDDKINKKELAIYFYNDSIITTTPMFYNDFYMRMLSSENLIKTHAVQIVEKGIIYNYDGDDLIEAYSKKLNAGLYKETVRQLLHREYVLTGDFNEIFRNYRLQVECLNDILTLRKLCKRAGLLSYLYKPINNLKTLIAAKYTGGSLTATTTTTTTQEPITLRLTERSQSTETIYSSEITDAQLFYSDMCIDYLFSLNRPSIDDIHIKDVPNVTQISESEYEFRTDDVYIKISILNDNEANLEFEINSDNMVDGLLTTIYDLLKTNDKLDEELTATDFTEVKNEILNTTVNLTNNYVFDQQFNLNNLMNIQNKNIGFMVDTKHGETPMMDDKDDKLLGHKLANSMINSFITSVNSSRLQMTPTSIEAALNSCNEWGGLELPVASQNEKEIVDMFSTKYYQRKKALSSRPIQCNSDKECVNEDNEQGTCVDGDCFYDTSGGGRKKKSTMKKHKKTVKHRKRHQSKKFKR
jgi:hypothetical protein